MKRLIILTLFISTLLSTSCKYEDGPKISLRTKKHRLINSWTIDKVYLSGVDKTDEYKQWLMDYRIDLRKDNSYMITYDAGGPSKTSFEKGLWAFSKDKKEVALIPYWNLYLWDTLPKRWKIIRLKEKSLWIKGNIIGDGKAEDEEVHFK